MLCCVVRSQAAEDPLSAAVCSNTVEAQVIVHLELDDPDKGKRAGEGEEQEEEYSPLGPPPPPHPCIHQTLRLESLCPAFHSSSLYSPFLEFVFTSTYNFVYLYNLHFHHLFLHFILFLNYSSNIFNQSIHLSIHPLLHPFFFNPFTPTC